MHGRPPFRGLGLVQLRERMEVPVSQRAALQRPSNVQEVHPPCTENRPGLSWFIVKTNSGFIMSTCRLFICYMYLLSSFLFPVDMKKIPMWKRVHVQFLYTTMLTYFIRHLNNTWAKLFIKRTGCMLWYMYMCIYLDTACLLYIPGCRWQNPRNPARQTEGGDCHKCACASQCRCHTWQSTHSIGPRVTSLRALKSMI